jgi:hypothetical protein
MNYQTILPSSRSTVTRAVNIVKKAKKKGKSRRLESVKKGNEGISTKPSEIF